MNLDWIAGFFDGEGSVSLRPSHSSDASIFRIIPRISMVQKNATPLRAIQRRIRMGHLRDRRNLGPAKRGVYQLDIESQHDCKRFVEMFAGRLLMKKRQMEILRRFIRIHRFHVNASAAQRRRELQLLLEMRAANGQPRRVFVPKADLIKSLNRWDMRLKKQRSAEKKLLNMLYWERQMSQGQIAEQLNVRCMTVMDRMHRHGIPLRPRPLAVSLGKAAASAKREISDSQSVQGTT